MSGTQQDWSGLCCPRCRAVLEGGGDELACPGCGSRFPIIAGIPDLRVFDDPYIAIEPDRAKARRIAERFDDSGFEELVDFYYSITPEVPPADRTRFKRGIMLGVERATQAALDAGSPPRSGPVLDLGCGTGAGLLAFPRPGNLGVDIALRWLVIGRKRMMEEGSDARLIAACAEALPLPDATVDEVLCLSALEHFRDSEAALREARRVLRSGGRLLIQTPNRRSPGPDPHTGLWGGGMLPDSVNAAYMRLRRARPPVRHLFTMTELEQTLRRVGFTTVRPALPGIPAATLGTLRGPAALMGKTYEAFRRRPGTRAALQRLSPTLLVTADVEGEPGTGPDRS